MSLITSCPACGTMFRVVPDQLKISEGWVRCGHCAEVFDATAHMATDPTPVAPAAAGHDTASAAGMPPYAPEPQVHAPAWPPEATEAARKPDEPRPLETQAPRQPEPEAALDRQAEAAPDSQVPDLLQETPGREPPRFEPPAPATEPDSVLEASPLDEPFVFRRSDLIEPDPVPSVLPALAPLPATGDSRHPEEDEDQVDEEDAVDRVSFVRQARRRAFWRSPAMRLLLVLVSLGLAGLLALQLAYHDRDRLALTQPQLRPLLARMCEQLGCRLQAPRQIEALVIDSSGFNRLRDDVYKLTFALRNTARVPVAAPAMELTLTDSQDQPLVRRVLTPAELGAPGNALAPGAEWTGSAGLQLAAGDPAQVAGYRLLAFYP